MQTFIQALNGGVMRVQNFKSPVNQGVYKTLRFGICAVSTFFLGLGALSNKNQQPLKIIINGSKQLSLFDSIKALQQMSKAEHRAIKLFAEYIDSSSSYLFGRSKQRQNSVFVYIAQILLNKSNPESIIDNLDDVSFGSAITSEIAARVATNLILDDLPESSGVQSYKSSWQSVNILAQIAEAAESVEQSLCHAGLAPDTIDFKSQSANPWSFINKKITLGLSTLFKRKISKPSSHLCMPSDCGTKWGDLLGLCQAIKYDKVIPSGAVL